MTPDPSDDATPAEKITAYIEDLGDWRGERLAQIRRIFQAADPEMVEEWKWMGSPVWSRHGMIAVANAHKGKVKVTFSHGAHLADARGVFNAGLGGSKWRAIDLQEHDAIDESAWTGLIEEAIAHNRSRGKKKKA